MKSLLFSVMLLALSWIPSTAVAQAIRWDPSPAATTQGSGQPFLLALPGTKVNFCTHPANTVPCTNYATTYTSTAMTTACPNNAQVVLSGSSSCQPTGDAAGNFGVYAAPGIYDYTLTVGSTSYGPYTVTLGTVGQAVSATTLSVSGVLSDGTSNTPNTPQFATGRAATQHRIDMREQGCDPTGVADCAPILTNVINNLISTHTGTPPNVSQWQIYFPAGNYYINSSIRLPGNISLVGDNQEASYLTCGPGIAASCFTAYQNNSAQCNGSACVAGYRDITIQGTGHGGTTQTLLELHTPGIHLTDMRLQNHAGRCLMISLNQERVYATNVMITYCAWPLIWIGANESYFNNLQITYPGRDFSGYCFTDICSGGVVPSGNVEPSVMGAIWTSAPYDQRIVGGTIKPLNYMNGIVTTGGNSGIFANLYTEAAPSSSSSPSVNASYVIGGRMPRTTISTAITSTTQTLLTLTNSFYFPDWFGLRSDAYYEYIQYALHCPDFVQGSSTPCAIGGGRLQGDYEIVSSQGISNDGMVVTRGQNGTTANTWPVGTVIQQIPILGSGDLTIQNMHATANNLSTWGGSWTPVCNDQYNMCGEIKLGTQPDGFVPRPGDPSLPGITQDRSFVIFLGDSNPNDLASSKAACATVTGGCGVVALSAGNTLNDLSNLYRHYAGLATHTSFNSTIFTSNSMWGIQHVNSATYSNGSNANVAIYNPYMISDGATTFWARWYNGNNWYSQANNSFIWYDFPVAGNTQPELRMQFLGSPSTHCPATMFKFQPNSVPAAATATWQLGVQFVCRSDYTMDISTDGAVSAGKTISQSGTTGTNTFLAPNNSFSGTIQTPNMKSTTGTNFVCVDTTGTFVKSTTACNGT